MAEPFNYQQFKTPFYDISIGPKTSGPFVKLPFQISRLCDKVEIVLSAGEICTQATATISFVGGSREPFLTLNTADASGLYNLGSDSKDNLTNAVSMLADLKFNFSGNTANFSSLASTATAAISGALDALASITGTTAEKIEVTKSQGKSGGGYLFEEGNAVKITWGYKELPKELNTKIFTIKMVQMDYPENDQSKLTIICQGAFADAEKLAPTTAQSYFIKLPGGLDPTAGVSFTFKGMSTQQILQKIANDAGFGLIMSKHLGGSIPEKDEYTIWPKGMTLIEFIRDLGGKHNAIATMDYHPQTGKPTIRFITRTDYYGRKILHDEFFHYKRAGSIIKSINIRADYGSQTGSGMVGMDEKGQVVGSVHEVPGQDQITLAEGEGLIDTVESTKKQPQFNQLANTISKGNVVAKMGYTPNVAKTENLKNESSSSAACANKTVALEFTSLGHPLLRPGVIKINGIGRRYSNTYKLMTVTHSLDSSGYICRVAAVGHSAAKDGGLKAGSTSIKNAPTDGTDSIQLTPQAAVSAASSVLTAFTDVEPPFTGTDSEVIDENEKFETGQPSTPVTGTASVDIEIEEIESPPVPITGVV